MKIIRVGNVAFNADQVVRATFDKGELKLDTAREAITLKFAGDTAKEIWNLLVGDADQVGSDGDSKKKKK